MLAKAVKNFPNSPDGLKVVHVKKGAIIDVDENAVDGMIDAEQIEDPEGKDYAKELEKAMTTKDDGGGEKSVGDMNKGELQSYAADVLGMEVDKGMNKADLLTAVNEAIANSKDEGGDA